jgi:hypothetical protein
LSLLCVFQLLMLGRDLARWDAAAKRTTVALAGVVLMVGVALGIAILGQVPTFPGAIAILLAVWSGLASLFSP